MKNKQTFALDLGLLLDNFRLSLCDGSSMLTSIDANILKNRIMALYEEYDTYDPEVDEVIEAMSDEGFWGG